jgi:hypothetical protein
MEIFGKGTTMTKLRVFTLTVLLLLLSSQLVYAQATTEYGRVLGGVGRRQERVNPKAARTAKQPATKKEVVQGMGDLTSTPLPSALTVESKEAALHHRHDEWSDKLIHLAYGETLIPIAETTAGNAHWYMVKTQTGLVGWVKSTDIKKEGNPPGGK